MLLYAMTTRGSKWLTAHVAHKYIDIHWSQWCASKELRALKKLCICDGTVTFYLFLSNRKYKTIYKILTYIALK